MNFKKDSLKGEANKREDIIFYDYKQPEHYQSECPNFKSKKATKIA